MLDKLRIRGFRGFREFELNDLGTVNLLVGMNNCGKTTVLEAVQLLPAIGDFSSIYRVMSRRGEEWVDGVDRYRNGRYADIRRLFNGHDIKPGRRFEIHGEEETKKQIFSADILESLSKQPQLFETDEAPAEADELLLPAVINFSWGDTSHFATRITRGGGVSLDVLRRAASATENANAGKTLLITTAALSAEATVAMFEDIVLTREEQLVIDALNVIEPSIERIAPSGTDRMRASSSMDGSKGGLVVRCKDLPGRIPIGSMGDGIWGMLGLSLSLVQAQGGILLVDEIDTGLHFTVMERMWKLIYETAKRLNVQVFATTHSRDCYESLAVICRDYVSDGSDITIQRIDREHRRGVGYTEQEIVAAAERGAEVR